MNASAFRDLWARGMFWKFSKLQRAVDEYNLKIFEASRMTINQKMHEQCTRYFVYHILNVVGSAADKISDEVPTASDASREKKKIFVSSAILLTSFRQQIPPAPATQDIKAWEGRGGGDVGDR